MTVDWEIPPLALGTSAADCVGAELAPTEAGALQRLRFDRKFLLRVKIYSAKFYSKQPYDAAESDFERVQRQPWRVGRHARPQRGKGFAGFGFANIISTTSLGDVGYAGSAFACVGSTGSGIDLAGTQ